MLCKNVLSTIDLSECPEATYFNGLLHRKEESISSSADIYISKKGYSVFTKELSDKDESSKDVKSTLLSRPFQYLTENLMSTLYHVNIRLTYNTYTLIFISTNDTIVPLDFSGHCEISICLLKSLCFVNLLSLIALLNTQCASTKVMLPQIYYFEGSFFSARNSGNTYANPVIPTIVFLTQTVGTSIILMITVNNSILGIIDRTLFSLISAALCSQKREALNVFDALLFPSSK